MLFIWFMHRLLLGGVYLLDYLSRLPVRFPLSESVTLRSISLTASNPHFAALRPRSLTRISAQLSPSST